jgi:hypothetical protein
MADSQSWSPLADVFPLDWKVATAYCTLAAYQALQHAQVLGLLPNESKTLAQAKSLVEQVNSFSPADEVGEVTGDKLALLVSGPILMIEKIQQAFRREFAGWGNHFLVCNALLAHVQTCLEHEVPDLLPAVAELKNTFALENAMCQMGMKDVKLK